MTSWYCKDCLRDCLTKHLTPDRVARVDADKYCNLFINPRSEPFFSESGSTKTCNKVNGLCNCKDKRDKGR